MSHQNGVRAKPSITTVLNTLSNMITTGFNQTQTPPREVVVMFDMSKAFDMVEPRTNTHTNTQTI